MSDNNLGFDADIDTWGGAETTAQGILDRSEVLIDNDAWEVSSEEGEWAVLREVFTSDKHLTAEEIEAGTTSYIGIATDEERFTALADELVMIRRTPPLTKIG